MKNFNLVLFLILNLVISISCADYKRFVHSENVYFRHKYVYNLFVNPHYIENDLNATCQPLYNSENLDQKKLDTDIAAFRFEMSLQMYMYMKPQLYDIVIFNGDLPKDGPAYGMPIVEVCQTFEFYAPRVQYKDFRISCRTREFRKEYTIALCARSSPINNYRVFLSIQAQRKMLRVSGYTK